MRRRGLFHIIGAVLVVKDESITHCQFHIEHCLAGSSFPNPTSCLSMGNARCAMESISRYYERVYEGGEDAIQNDGDHYCFDGWIRTGDVETAATADLDGCDGSAQIK